MERVQFGHIFVVKVVGMILFCTLERVYQITPKTKALETPIDVVVETRTRLDNDNYTKQK